MAGCPPTEGRADALRDGCGGVYAMHDLENARNRSGFGRALVGWGERSRPGSGPVDRLRRASTAQRTRPGNPLRISDSLAIGEERTMGFRVLRLAENISAVIIVDEEVRPSRATRSRGGLCRAEGSLRCPVRGHSSAVPSSSQHPGGNTPGASQPRPTSSTVRLRKRGGRHRHLRWWLGEMSAGRCAQPRMRPAFVAGPRRTGRKREPTCLAAAARTALRTRRARPVFRWPGDLTACLS